MDKHLRRIEIRRGLNSQRTNVLYEEGEPVYLVDKKRVYIGDNQKMGGNLASNINFVQENVDLPQNSVPTDILIDKTESNGYFINEDNNLIKIFNICCADVQDFIDRTNNFLDGLSTEYCSTDKGINTDTEILINNDKDVFLQIDNKFCNLPIFNQKYLNFRENKTYTLDISKPLKTQYINFNNNNPDSDGNVPPKIVFIKNNSTSVSQNIQLVDSDIGTITVKTNNLINGIPELAWIRYDLQNSCGSTTTGIVSGFIDPSNIRRFLFNYDYLILSTEFVDGLDLDLYVGIINPKIQKEDVYYNNQNFSDIIIHGGNNIGSNTEYILLDIKKFKDIYPEVSNITLDIKCIWNTKPSNNPIYLNVDLYKGGYYIKNSTNNGFNIINYSQELHIREFSKIIPSYKTISRYCTINADLKEYITVLNSKDTEILN